MYLLKRYVRQLGRINQIAKKTPEEMCLEDGVVGAVHVAKEEHVVVVSHSLTVYNLYEFIYYFKSFII